MSFNASKVRAQKSLIQYRHESQLWAERAKHAYPLRAWQYVVKEANNCFRSIIFPQDNLVRKLFVNEHCWVSHDQQQDYIVYLFQSAEEKAKSSFLSNLDGGNSCRSSLMYMKLLTQTISRKDLESFQLVLNHFLNRRKDAQHLLNHLLCYCIDYGKRFYLKVFFQHNVRIRPCPQQPSVESELHHAVRFVWGMIRPLICMPQIDINVVNDLNLTPLLIMVSDPIRNYTSQDKHAIQQMLQLFLDHHATVDTIDRVGQNIVQRCLQTRLCKQTQLNLIRKLAPLVDLSQRNLRDESIVHTLLEKFDDCYHWPATINVVREWASFGCYHLTQLDQSHRCPLYQIIVQSFFNALRSVVLSFLGKLQVQDLINMTEFELENQEHNPDFFIGLTLPSRVLKGNWYWRPIHFIMWPKLFELIYKYKGMLLFNAPHVPGNLLFSNLVLKNESMVKLCLKHDMAVFFKDKFLASTGEFGVFRLSFLLTKPTPCHVCEQIQCNKKTCNPERYIEWQLVCTFWACGFVVMPNYFTSALTHPIARLAYKWGTIQCYSNELQSLETSACIFLRQYFLQNVSVNLISCAKKLDIPKHLSEALCLGLDFDWAFES